MSPDAQQQQEDPRTRVLGVEQLIPVLEAKAEAAAEVSWASPAGHDHEVQPHPHFLLSLWSTRIFVISSNGHARSSTLRLFACVIPALRVSV